MNEQLPRGTRHDTDNRLKLYSLAAAAAGVSMMALSQPALGEVVTTRKHIPLEAGHPVSIDLNHDGIADFEFSVTSFRSSVSSHLNVKETVKPAQGGGLMGGAWNAFPGPYASALARGAKIGPSGHFVAGNVVVQRLSEFSSGQGGTYGNWPWTYYGTEVRFLGVKFQIDGQTHYGWIRLAVGVGRAQVPGAVLGYGYETIANKRLSAGLASTNAVDAQAAPSSHHPSLGMLAAGADGLALWRREQIH